MHGSSGSRGLLVHLMAGAALGAVVVLVVWIFSGGRPFGEVVGTSDVSSPTTAAVKQTDVRSRAAAPAGTDARLESELPALAARKAKAKARGAKRGGDSIQFRKPAAKRPAKAARDAAAKRRSRAKARSRKRQVVRVVAPPTEAGGEDTPVAAVPSPAPAAAPAPVAKPAPAAKRAKPRQPTYVAGAGEG
jgi:hypothetical protein